MNISRDQMANKSSGFSELKARLLFVLGALIVYRIGSHIPVPGIDPKALQVMFEQQSCHSIHGTNEKRGRVW